MADLDNIFDTNWNSDNVTEPAIIRDELRTFRIYNRVVTCRLMRQREDYMGIIDRDKYTPESHDGWIVRIVSATQNDTKNMINETRRICAQYNGTTGEDKFITWEVGDWETKLPYRWEFRFIVMVKKAGVNLG